MTTIILFTDPFRSTRRIIRAACQQVLQLREGSTPVRHTPPRLSFSITVATPARISICVNAPGGAYFPQRPEWAGPVSDSAINSLAAPFLFDREPSQHIPWRV